MKDKEEKAKDEYSLNEQLPTEEKENGKKDADHYTRILVAITLAAAGFLILFNVFGSLFTARSTYLVQSNAVSSRIQVSSSHLSETKSDASSSKVSQSTVPSHSAAPQSSSKTDISGIVYWTPKGSVYHTNRNCSALSRSSNISSGSVEQAIAAGKKKPCKICGGK